MSDAHTCATCAHLDEHHGGPNCGPCIQHSLNEGQSHYGWTPIRPPEPGSAPSTGGTKHDGEKPRMDLLDPLWLTKVSEVLTFGAKKYAANNWRQGIAQSRLIAAALRHLMAHSSGEDVDPESGQPHLAHASCCLMFLTNMAVTRPDLDDRPKPVSAIA